MDADGGWREAHGVDAVRPSSAVQTADARDGGDIELRALKQDGTCEAGSLSTPVSSHQQLRGWRQAPSGQLDGDRAPLSAAAEAITQDEEVGIDRQEQGPEPLPEQEGFLHSLYTISYLVLFSLLGTLARIGTNIITTYPGEPVTSTVLWSNFAGSLVMGFLVEDRVLFGLPHHLRSKPSQRVQPHRAASESSVRARAMRIEDDTTVGRSHLKHKKTLPLYVGLTTGFCGCYTSFSSYLRDAFLNLTNEVDIPSTTQAFNIITNDIPKRNGAFSFEAFLAIVILHPALSMMALTIGTQLALVLRDRRNPWRMRSGLPQSFIARFVDPLVVVLGLGAWLACLVLSVQPPSQGRRTVTLRTRVLLPLLLAPPGCLLRYYLAKWFNKPSLPNFPLGTFIANIIGCLVMATAYDLRHAGGIGATWTGHGLAGSVTVCAVMAGIEQGFCGSLTTVSTWVVELNSLGRLAAWKYGGISLVVGLAGMFIIMGSMHWTIGFDDPVC